MADRLPPLPPPPPPVAPPPPPSPGAGLRTSKSNGFFGTLAAIPGDIVDDAKDIATGFIPGLIETGKAVGADIGNLAGGDASFSNSERIAVAVIKGIAEDFRHPLRNPLNTLLNVWGIASLGAGTAARGAAGARAVSQGGNVTKALLKGPGPEMRTIRLEGAPDLAAGTYSRSALTRQIQKATDTYREANPDTRLPIRTQRQRYARTNVRMNYEFPQQIERAAANELRILSKKITPAEQVALRVFAENTPIEKRIAYHDNLIADLDNLAARNTQRGNALLEAAKKYVVTDADGQVQWAAGTEKLQEVYGKMEDVVTAREKALVESGLMTPEGIASRRDYPGRVIAGGRYFSKEQAARTQKYLDNLVKRNDAEMRRLTQELSDTRAGTARTATAVSRLDEATGRSRTLRSGTRSVKATRKVAAEAAARIERLSDRLAKDGPLMERLAAVRRSGEQISEVEARRLAAAELRFTRNARKLSEAQVAKRVAETKLAVARVRDTTKARELLADAERQVKIARDVQQALIILQKRMIANLTRERRTLTGAIDEVQQNAGKLVGGEGANTGRVMVPFANRDAVAAVFKIAGLGSRGVVGVPKGQSWLRPWKGSLLAKGGGRYDTLALQAERSHEAVRFIALVKFRHELIQMASDSPAGMREPVALRMDELRNAPLPAGVRQILSKVDDDVKLTKDERAVFGTAYETVRDTFFDAKAARALDLEAFEPIPGVRWIERDMLGGLDRPSPLVGLDAGAGRIVLRSVDEINNVAKFITLYLRPATIVPNILSGLALNLVQQGVFAPSNLARAYALHWKMRPAARALLDQVMGEGRAGVLKTDRGIGAAAVNAGAGFFGTVQDLPFRRAAFLHEARREGYRTLKDIDRLVTDPALRDTLFRVKERANGAIIDYSNLGKFERDLLRRAFYFYPWLKGATVYSGRFLTENPVQALAVGQVGQMGNAVSEQQFGAIPSWAEGLYQVGSRDGVPLSVSTGGILPFSTAADMAGTAFSMFSGDTSPAQQLTANLSPVASAFLAALTGKSGLGATLPERGFAEQFARQLADNTTLASLIKKTTQDQSGKTFPVTPLDALLGYLAGNAVYARPTNVAVLNRLAAKEDGGA